jgi:DNA integrity scanning protein DisA with diadenylate cyclase activity
MKNKIKSKETNKLSKLKIKKIKEKILGIAIEIAKEGEGALFVIGKGVKYTLLKKQKVKPFNLFDRGSEKILKGIAVIDGAVIIDNQGNVLSYSAMIQKTRPFFGYGTRHAAAMTASKNGNLAILCSQEEHKVKIFKNGRLIMQLDAFQKNIEKEIPQISSMLESLGAGVIGTIGVAALAPALGIALIPGVLVFGVSYYAIKKIVRHVKK